ncbi:MAG: hypothetical protein AAF363_05325, partial [Bacteroidota bacterium]
QLLNKQYENALTSFDEAIDKDSDMALAHYCSAIASARLGKEAQGLDHLKNAVSADPTLKDKALSDLEFSKYASTDQFRDALK